MEKKYLFLVTAMLAVIASGNALTLSGPENVFLNQPRSLAFEIANEASEAREIKMNIYCPGEIDCELLDAPTQIGAFETVRFGIFFGPYMEAVNKQYIITLIAETERETELKEIKVSVGAPAEPTEPIETPEDAPKEPAAPFPAIFAHQEIILNILLAIIAITLLFILIIKLKEIKATR